MSSGDARYRTLLVTGAAGFLGRHLLAHLREADDPPRRVVGVDLRARAAASDGAESHTADLTDPQAAREALARFEPDGVIHLAGLTHGRDVDACFAVNVGICRNIISAASVLPRPPRVLVVGSAAEYGLTAADAEGVSESHPLAATTVYGVSKIMQERWALAAGGAGGAGVVCVRPFNILGPGQPEGLVPAAFLRQVADVFAGRAGEVRVGNTATSRDFTDARDVAAALWSLMRAGPAADGEVFNIASGAAVRIADLLEAAIALGRRDVPVVRDPARSKPADVPIIVGDAGKLGRLTGWSPRIPWRESMEDMWAELRPAEAGGR